MGRIKSGDIWANDDFMQHVACDAMARRENDEQKAGAMARMEARCKNALRFIGGAQQVKARREWAEEVKRNDSEY